jgi:hypothetical protein
MLGLESATTSHAEAALARRWLLLLLCCAEAELMEWQGALEDMHLPVEHLQFKFSYNIKTLQPL